MQFEIRERHNAQALLFSWEELEDYLRKEDARFRMFDEIKVDGELTYAGDVVCKDSGATGYALYARGLTRSVLEEFKAKLLSLQGEREKYSQ